MTDTRAAGQQGAVTAAPTADELAEALRAHMLWVDIAVQYLPFSTLALVADEYARQRGMQMTPDAHTILDRYDAALEALNGKDNG